MKPDFADMRAHFERAQAIVLVGGRAFVAYPYRDAKAGARGRRRSAHRRQPGGVRARARGRHGALGDIGADLAEAAGRLDGLLDGHAVAARLADAGGRTESMAESRGARRHSRRGA